MTPARRRRGTSGTHKVHHPRQQMTGEYTHTRSHNLVVEGVCERLLVISVMVPTEVAVYRGQIVAVLALW